METWWEDIDVDGDPMPTYVAVPDGDGPFPAVVVNQGLGSVEETIQELTRRMARDGFVAAAPTYYHRQKDNILEEVRALQPGSPDRTRRLFEKVQQLRDEEVIADGRAAAAYLQALPRTAPGRIGVVGFCLGGRITYLQTTAIADFKASAALLPGRSVDFVGRRAVGVRPVARHIVSHPRRLRLAGRQSEPRGHGGARRGADPARQAPRVPRLRRRPRLPELQVSEIQRSRRRSILAGDGRLLPPAPRRRLVLLLPRLRGRIEEGAC